MLIPLFFLWEWAYWETGLNLHNNLQFDKLQEFHSIGDMLIGSIKPLQAPYLKSFFVCA